MNSFAEIEKLFIFDLSWLALAFASIFCLAEVELTVDYCSLLSPPSTPQTTLLASTPQTMLSASIMPHTTLDAFTSPGVPLGALKITEVPQTTEFAATSLPHT